MQAIVRDVLGLLGWTIKAETVAAPFGHQFGLLGVRFDLAGAASDAKVEVSNTAKRAEELRGTIGELLKAAHIDPHAAATLAGRLGFAGAQCFGRLGAAFLAPVRRAAERKSRSPMTGQLAAALRWWLVFLAAATPRTLRFSDPEPPLIVFGDGCCEPWLCGVGAVLWDRLNGRCEAFGLEVWPDVVAALREAVGAFQIIGQLELLPHLLAFWRWPDAFVQPGRRCLYFVDNDAARYGLIRGYSPAPASRALIEAFWIDAARAQVATWFARVPTKGNPADAPSRLAFDSLGELRPAPRRVDPPRGRRRLMEFLKGGTLRPRVAASRPP